MLLVLPLAVVDLPPLLDYPNHLARMLILAEGGRDPALARYWQPAWDILPNIATDLIIPPLARVMPLTLAGRLVLGGILLLLYAAILLHHRAAFGRAGWWSVAGALVVCNGLFLLGFLNFTLGLAIALLVGALWIAERERRPALAIAGATLGVAAVFFCHVIDVLFAAVLIGSQEVLAVIAAQRGGGRWAREALGRAAAVAVVVAPAVLLYGASPLAEASGKTNWYPWDRKALELLLPVAGYRGALDAATGVAILGVLAFGLRRRGVHAPSLLACCIFLAFFAATPFAVHGAAFVDARFPVMLGLMVFAGFDPRLPPRAGRIAAALLGALLVLRSGVAAEAWAAHRADLVAIRQAIAPIEPGSRVLVATARDLADTAYWRSGPRSRALARLGTMEGHFGALVVLERRAFIPLLFTIRGQQPLAVRDEWRHLSFPRGIAVDYRLLGRRDRTAAELEEAPYLASWPDEFDYLLVLLPDAAPGLPGLPEGLEKLTDTGTAALFRVGHFAGATSTLSR
ncbi:hypothetical protein [Falsiroseomonas sp. HW251]|uniref:hypothetical protein n=1 Tax=Falsiroseomonas sp. HW251 TaxID=3390998 RepID=UPI003D318ABE